MPGRPLLASRDFRLLLAGQTTSQFGTQVSGVAVPLLAVLTLHASPFELGLVSASGTLAFAVIGLPAGAWLDRVRRDPCSWRATWPGRRCSPPSRSRPCWGRSPSRS